MKLRLSAAAIAAALTACVLLVPPAVASNPHAAGALSAPITQSFVEDGATYTLTGQFVPTRFFNSGGQLMVAGNVVGQVTDAAGNVVQTVDQAVTTTATDPPAGACSILDLTLGPLHLDLLGLVVDLNQVHLQITAQPGPGNLLGNLLCAVANLGNGGGSPLNAITNLLNQIRGLLGSL